MDASKPTLDSTRSVSDKVKIIMQNSKIPLHYLDVDDLLLEVFGTKHASYAHLKSNSEYIQLNPAVYIHFSNATDTFIGEFESTKKIILSEITQMLEFAKIPVPSKCFAAYFTNKFDTFVTNRSIRSIIAKICEEHSSSLYRTGGSAIALKSQSYDANIVTATAKQFSCKSCTLERVLPLPIVTKWEVEAMPRRNTPPLRTYPEPPQLVPEIKTSHPYTSKLLAPSQNLVRPYTSESPATSQNIIAPGIACSDHTYKLTKLVAEYENLDEAMIDNFFVEVMNSDDPEGLIPINLYENWKTTVAASEYAVQMISDVAASIEMPWPIRRTPELLGDFLNYEITSIKMIPGFGRKKVRTLLACVAYAAYKTDKSKFTSYSKGNQFHPIHHHPIFEQPLTFERLLAAEKPSSLIKEETWSKWCELIDTTPLKSASIYEIARKYRLDWPYSKRNERIGEYTKFSLHRILCTPGFGNKKIRTLVLCIAKLGLTSLSVDYSSTSSAKADIETVSHDADSFDFNTLIKLMREAIAIQSYRDRDIVKKRYGIDGEESQTFDEIGAAIGVSKARAQQIIKEITEKINFTDIGNRLPTVISKLDVDALWNRLANPYSVLEKVEVTRAFTKKLNGEFLLALDCCNMSVSSWLATIAVESSAAWYRSALSPIELTTYQQKAKNFLQHTGTHLPLVTVANYLELSQTDAGTVICLLPEYKIYDGYVVSGRIASRAKRTVHLHKLLCHENAHLSLHDLTIWHNSLYPNESCTSRDADIVMREAPHLFVLMGEKGWCSIGSYQVEDLETSELIDSPDDAGQPSAPEMDDESTVASIIRSILKKRNFANFTDIVEDFKILAGDSYSERSVGPILFTRDEFAKYAPSVYGFTANLQGFANIDSSLLLNEYDCQLFAMARYAGEEFYSFPLWTPAMEYRWCVWVERINNQELKESLFYIASPDEWPINDKLIPEWKQKIEDQADSYYFLREPKYDTCKLPGLRTLYALIRYAKDTCSINWISANRVLGRRIDDYHTAIDLAFLVCLGVISPTYQNWQKQHFVRKDAIEIESTLSAMLHLSPDANWDSEAGTYLVDTFTISINVLDTGWVNVTELNHLFYNATHTCPADTETVTYSKPVETVSVTYSKPVDIVPVAHPEPMLYPGRVAQLEDILSTHFANGFRLNSPIELLRFRTFYQKNMDKELTLHDEDLKSRIAACGTNFDGKIYAVSAQAKERIRRLAEDYFTNGAQAIFFAEFYTKNESWLFEASVVSEDMLIEILRKLFPKLSFTQTYFGYTYASIIVVLEGEILRVWGDNVLRTYGQLIERLFYIPLERIKSVLSQNSDFIWNSVETFAHLSKINITDEERQVIREAVSRECNSRGYASIADLPLSEIEERNYTISLTALHNAVYRICLSDKFDIKGKIVTRKGDTLDALTIMKNYCLTIEKCSLDDLLSYEKELTGEINRWIPMEAGNTVLVRIDKDHYVADKLVHFDVEAVDAAIELFIEGDYLPLISFTTFGAFPHCGQTWNLFLLESYCRRFSRKFRFDTPSINSRNAGAVIRKTCGMDYTEIMTDAVANADVPLKDTAVGKFLYENGYTGRSTTAKVNEIISNAKTMQIKKD